MEVHHPLLGHPPPHGLHQALIPAHGTILQTASLKDVDIIEVKNVLKVKVIVVITEKKAIVAFGLCSPIFWEDQKILTISVEEAKKIDGTLVIAQDQDHALTVVEDIMVDTSMADMDMTMKTVVTVAVEKVTAVMGAQNTRSLEPFPMSLTI
jgi:hypothetical protein